MNDCHRDKGNSSDTIEEARHEIELLRQNGIKESELRRNHTAEEIIASASRPIQNLNTRLSFQDFLVWLEENYAIHCY